MGQQLRGIPSLSSTAAPQGNMGSSFLPGSLAALSQLAELTALGRLASLGTGTAFNYKFEDDPSAWGVLTEVGHGSC